LGTLSLVVDRLNLVSAFRQLGSSAQRKNTLFALASGHLLVQSTFIPITLTIPSLAGHFGASVEQAAWAVIIRLLALGSTVFLAARLGERYGHIQVFMLGLVVMTLTSIMAATSMSLTQLIVWSGLGGLGGALVTANSNAILAMVFHSSERGRAFAVPVTSAQLGSLAGVAIYGIFLHFFVWQLVFISAAAVGVAAIWLSYPLLKYRGQQEATQRRKVRISYPSALLLMVTLAVFILSGSHFHDGAESFTSPQALGYHVPMHLLALSLAGLFLVVQMRSREPFLDFRYFKRKYFTMALFSNTTFHLSMLTIFTLVPIVVEDGLGYSPIVVSIILLCHQSFGLWLPAIAGLIQDRYSPRWLGPGALMAVAVGVGLLASFATHVPIWGLPLLLLPASVGTGLFISPYNALVMNTLPENRSFASGMLETSRQMGHTVGTTIAATVLGMSLPASIGLLPPAEAQEYYQQGFRLAALIVVWIVLSGAVVAIFQRGTPAARREESPGLAPQASGDG
jgi:MFS transporter, DHA2 family, methylenomycin A resistance protein